MGKYSQIKKLLHEKQKTWLITGVAGFIGSNILETLLLLNQKVIGLDNFITGYKNNLDEVKAEVGESKWSNFHFIEGDIRNIEDCRSACKGVDYVLHQAALGSVPRSIADPISSNEVNIGGFLNILIAARDESVSSFTYAASSSTYGDHPALPKKEENIGNPLSPYAVTKYANELYADVFSKTYGFECIGLRYFNVFGKRQDPNGAYAAVIPKWISSMLRNDEVHIYGDGHTSRDFCYIDNTVQINILAAMAEKKFRNNIYNVAFNKQTSLNELFDIVKASLHKNGHHYKKLPVYSKFRQGDVRHSLAKISKAKDYLGYNPKYSITDGIAEVMPWYIKNN